MSITRKSQINRALNSPRIVQVIPTVSTSPAYTAADVVGGKMTIQNVCKNSGDPCVLDEIKLIDKSNQKPVLEIIFFEADPTATTFTDNAALAINAADMSKVLGRVPVASGDWVTVGGIGIADVKNIGMMFRALAGTTVYAVAVTSSTPTFTSTTAIEYEFVFYPLK